MSTPPDRLQRLLSALVARVSPEDPELHSLLSAAFAAAQPECQKNSALPSGAAETARSRSASPVRPESLMRNLNNKLSDFELLVEGKLQTFQTTVEKRLLQASKRQDTSLENVFAEELTAVKVGGEEKFILRSFFVQDNGT